MTVTLPENILSMGPAMLFEVASASTPGRTWHVWATVMPDGSLFWQCQCPGYVNRKRCHHVTDVTGWLVSVLPRLVAPGTAAE